MKDIGERRMALMNQEQIEDLQDSFTDPELFKEIWEQVNASVEEDDGN